MEGIKTRNEKREWKKQKTIESDINGFVFFLKAHKSPAHSKVSTHFHMRKDPYNIINVILRNKLVKRFTLLKSDSLSHSWNNCQKHQHKDKKNGVSFYQERDGMKVWCGRLFMETKMSYTIHSFVLYFWIILQNLRGRTLWCGL